MKIQTISYADTEYYENLRRRLIEDCNKFGLTNHHSYDKKWLHSTQFYKDNKGILDSPRGAGFWAWKPFIIMNALAHVAENDIVCYMDASTTLREDPTSTINSVKDILVCDSAWVNRDWVKRDCFHYMNCDSDMYYNATQVWAGVVIVRNTEVSNDFINDWLTYCCDRRIITDDKSTSGPELSCFRDHRHDQSVLTLLITKYIKEYEMLGIETRPTIPFVDE